MNCPICGKTLINEACPSCGYDRTIDREQFPTLCRIAGKEPAKSARIAKNLITPISARLDDMDRRFAALETAFAELKDSIGVSKEKSQEINPEQREGQFEEIEEEITQNINPERKQSRFAKATVGSKISFGSYWQDKTKGKAAIEWRVLAKEAHRILVISEKAIDCQKYYPSYNAATWKTCSLRTWMNGKFLNNAFSKEEQAQILSTTVSADKNPMFGTSPGNATVDKVFLLSIAEAKKYFSSNKERVCAPTAYAKAHGAYTSDSCMIDGTATCWWWLRSPGYSQNNTAFVYFSGSVNCSGRNVDCDGVCVRPAMWISIVE